MQGASVWWLWGSGVQAGQWCWRCGWEQSRDGDSCRGGRGQWSESNYTIGRGEGCLLNPAEQWRWSPGRENKKVQRAGEAGFPRYRSVPSFHCSIPPFALWERKIKPIRVGIRHPWRYVFKYRVFPFKSSPAYRFWTLWRMLSQNFSITYLLYNPPPKQQPDV